jgi:hypothetical protein
MYRTRLKYIYFSRMKLGEGICRCVHYNRRVTQSIYTLKYIYFKDYTPYAGMKVCIDRPVLSCRSANTYKARHVSIETQTDKETDRDTDRQTGRQTDRQTGRHTYIHIYIHTYIHRQTYNV